MQDGRHFPDDIFKCISSNKKVWLSSKVSLKSIPYGRINNKPALVQIMAWRRIGIVYWRLYASLGLNEFKTISESTNTLYALFQCLFQV